MAPRKEPKLEDRIARLEGGWMEASRLTGRLVKELTILQAHVKECDSSLTSVLLLLGGLEEVFSAVSENVANG